MKTLLTTFLVLLSFVSFAQDPMYESSSKSVVQPKEKVQSLFTLTPKGFVSTEDVSKDYIVLNIDVVSQADLFKKVLGYLHKVYRSPKDVISQIDNESITVNGVQDNTIRRNRFHVLDLNYTITYEFKDNKIKVNAPGFVITGYSDGPQTLHLVANNSFTGSSLGIYNTKHQLKSELAKEDLEFFFNKHISLLQEGLNSKGEDW